jgi:hypothetical protein
MSAKTIGHVQLTPNRIPAIRPIVRVSLTPAL